MSLPHYDVDKEFVFDRLLVIDVEESISLYCQGDIKEMLIGDTTPEFLARFRRVKYDGTLYPLLSLQTVDIPEGSKIVIKKDAGIGILAASGIYYEFNREDLEKLEREDFPDDQFGDFNTYISITYDNFQLFLDSFKIKPKKASAKNSINAFVVEEDEENFEEEYDDEFVA